MFLCFDEFYAKKDGLDLMDSLWIIGEIRSKTPFLAKMLPVSNRITLEPFRVEKNTPLNLFLHVLM